MCEFNLKHFPEAFRSRQSSQDFTISYLYSLSRHCPSPPRPRIQLAHPSGWVNPAARQLQVGWFGTVRNKQDVYIIEWNRVRMKLLSQTIKVNYQRQNAAARKGEALPWNCVAIMNNIISEYGEETQSRTYQHNTERVEERERERDGAQHWLPNYAFYHFSHNRVPPFFSCQVYWCSCSSAALMRKIKNNHKRVIFTSTDQQIASHRDITHTNTQIQIPSCFNNMEKYV